MPKLTDTQLVILSGAARREDGAVLPLPKSLKLQGGALSGVLRGLLKKGLVAERLARADDPAWRNAEDGRRVTLMVTEAGLQAIGAGGRTQLPPRPPPRPSPGPRGAPPQANPRRRRAAGASQPRPQPTARRRRHARARSRRS